MTSAPAEYHLVTRNRYHRKLTDSTTLGLAPAKARRLPAVTPARECPPTEAHPGRDEGTMTMASGWFLLPPRG